MSIELPELDDKTYADLVNEARAAIPTIHPGWTDHNPSDPGITLIEMFAFLTEAIIYRTGRISQKTERSFLRLLSGGAHGNDNEADLGAATEATLRDLNKLYRAVTPDDYERLVKTDFPGASQVGRVLCLAERNLVAQDKLSRAPGHVSLVVLSSAGDPWFEPPAALTTAIYNFLAERRVITTSLHVVFAYPALISLEATVYLRDDAPPDAALMRTRITNAVLAHFHPTTGGANGQGWPFGRDIDLSDMFAIIDEVAGVEYVDTDPATWKLTAPNDSLGSRSVQLVEGKQSGLRLEAHELPRFLAANIKITLRERRGTQWQTIV